MKHQDRLLRLVGYALVALVLAGLFGRLRLHEVNDSPSYLNYPFDSLSAAMASIRTPAYPLFLAIVGSTIGLSFVPTLQVLLHAFSAWFLGEELLERKMPEWSALGAGAAVLVGCTPTDHIHTISTDAPAASLGVVVVVLLLRATRLQHWSWWVACGTVTLLTIFVRPAYLFLLVWLPVIGALLHRHDRGMSLLRGNPKLRIWHASITAAAVLGALLVWMTARHLVVHDFGLVPFGHQNLSAVLVQTVPRSKLNRLRGHGGELATLVAEKMAATGFEMADERSSLATMQIESQWGRINYEIIIPTARELESAQESDIALAVREHRRIAAMNSAILSSSPKGYFRWLMLAARRAVWGSAANIAMHPIFLSLIIAGSMALVVRVSSGTAMTPMVLPPGWSAFALVAVSYAFFKIGFVILSSPPLGRFADAGAIFLPALAASLIFQPHRDSIDRATRRLLRAEQ
ncbi:MAG: hypothetical protein AAFU85_16285 [Planctomycetota bacterium]